MAATASPGLRLAPVAPLSEDEFAWICRYLHARTGIALNDSKKPLVMGRLDKRVRAYGLSCYADYFELLEHPGHAEEAVLAVDLLTTNETYFFREPRHFDFLRETVFPAYAAQRSLRIWSAASSSGEEAYTLALMLAAYYPSERWEVIGTDISTRVLEKARRGLYPLSAAEKIPQELLRRYCLKGREEYEDFFLIDASLRSHVHFLQGNLVGELPDLGLFEVIFLRNVMIYFDLPTKHRLVARLCRQLQPGGYFFVSHSETLNGMEVPLKLVRPSIYRKDS